MTDSILYWNQVALDAAQTAFSSPDPAKSPTPQQPGPTRTARALAIVHLAMHDAYMGGKGTATYLPYSTTPGTTDVEVGHAAVAAAACLTLIAMFSRQHDTLLLQRSQPKHRPSQRIPRPAYAPSACAGSWNRARDWLQFNQILLIDPAREHTGGRRLDIAQALLPRGA